MHINIVTLSYIEFSKAGRGDLEYGMNSSFGSSDQNRHCYIASYLFNAPGYKASTAREIFVRSYSRGSHKVLSRLV